MKSLYEHYVQTANYSSLYFTVLALIFIIVCVVEYRHWSKLERADKIGAFVGSLVLTAIGTIFIELIVLIPLLCINPMPYETSQEFELCALVDNMNNPQLHGSFFLAIGTISGQNNEVYYYYINTAHGQRAQKLSIFNSVPIYVQELEQTASTKSKSKLKPKLIIYTQRYKNNFYQYAGANMPCRYIFLVPKGSVCSGYKLDLE